MDHAVLRSGDVKQVLQRYRPLVRPERWEQLGAAGGFSGAVLWRIETAQGSLCLRMWPLPHPSRERLEWIHQVMAQVWKQGFQRLPLPLKTDRNETFIEHADHLWELTRWMPGRADFGAAPSVARLRSAAEALAEFHLAAEAFPGSWLRCGPAPGLVERQQRFHALAAGGARRIAACLSGAGWPQLESHAIRILKAHDRLAPRLAAETSAAARQSVPLQPCLRDSHVDHVLYDGAKVTAFVDFGALRVESVAADVARLLGSMAVDDPAWWSEGLAAYHAVRPLADEERSLLAPFDRASVLLSALNWLQWIYVDRRRFENSPAVAERIDRLLERLERLEQRRHAVDRE